MTIIDGKLTAEAIKSNIKKEVALMIDNDQRAPHLAAVLVGEDGASKTYVASKEKACKAVGFTSSLYRFESDITEEKLLDIVNYLNNDPEVDGFIVQLPLPKHINVDRVIESINPAKDVDGFHPINLGRMVAGVPGYLPATPYGIMQLLEHHNIDTEGKHCVVLGRSNIVGTPINILMSRKSKPGNCTVTMCHSRTKNLSDFTRQADIIIAAIGKPEFVKADMVKEGAVIIDVGIHRVKDDSVERGYRIVGDVDYEEVSKVASAITPVPGGVGAMTIVALLMNTLEARKKTYFK